MKWFDNWFAKKVLQSHNIAMERESDPRQMSGFAGFNNIMPKSSNISMHDSTLNQDRCIRFNVYVANGGRIVETFMYDDRKDRSQKGLYIIGNDQDFGHEIDKIITMEALKT